MKNNNNFIIGLSSLVSFYFFFNLVFFIFLGNVSSDTIIGFSFFFLLFLIYKKGRKTIYSYLWSLTKNIYINFFSLINLLVSFRKLVIGFNLVYLEYFRYNFISLNIVINELSNILFNTNIVVTNNYFINNYLLQLKMKYNFIFSNTNYFPLEFNFQNSSLFELNKMLSFDVINFIFK